MKTITSWLACLVCLSAIHCFGAANITEEARRLEGFNTTNAGLARAFARSAATHVVKVYFNRSFVRTPPEQKLDFSADDTATRSNVNDLQSLEKTDIFRVASKSEQGTTSEHFKGWSYIATRNGIMITSPGAARNRFGNNFGASREQVNPTLWPWFSPAISTTKAVVILVHESAKLKAKKIVAKILTTLTYSDYVSVVVCTSVPKGRVPGDCAADPTHHFCLKKAEDNVTTSLNNSLGEQPVASLVSAFKHAFQDLGNLSQDDVGDKMILFMASDTFSPQSTERILQTVGGLQPKDPHGKVSVLGYSFGAQNSDDGLARQLACENYGVWTKDGESADMVPYFSLISMAAEHADLDPSFVHFTSPYRDSDHLGEIITMSTAMYEEHNCAPGSSGWKRTLLGVAGSYTQVHMLDEGLMDAYEKLLRAAKRPPLSIFHNVTNLECQLQILRKTLGSECPARVDNPEDCFRIGDDNHYYIEHRKHATFKGAQEGCQRAGGRLASADSMDVKAYFASVVPRLGAWIQPGMNSEMACPKIDPRGRTDNVVGHPCRDVLPYVCQFDRQPNMCKVQCWGGSDVLDLELKAGELANAAECEAANECKPLPAINITIPKDDQTVPLRNWPLPHVGSRGLSWDQMLKRVCCSAQFNCAGSKNSQPPNSDGLSIQDGNQQQGRSSYNMLTGVLLFGISSTIIALVAIAVLIQCKCVWHPPRLVAVSTADVVRENRLGAGFSGIVNRGMWREKAVALKTFYWPTRQDAKNELETFRVLPLHPRIIRCYGSCFGVEKDGNKEDTITLILELMQMNLEQFMSDCERHRGITYKELFQVFYDIAAGLGYLHKHNFLHLDLKPRNVLITLDKPHSRPVVKLCDFGMSIECVMDSIDLDGTRGTPGYMAPEMALGLFGATPKVTRKTDVFSLGRIMDAYLVPRPGTGDPRQAAVRMLVRSCTQEDPADRPSAWEVCSTLKKLMKKKWASQGMFDYLSPANRDQVPESRNTTTSASDESRHQTFAILPTPFQINAPPPMSWMGEGSGEGHVEQAVGETDIEAQ